MAKPVKTWGGASPTAKSLTQVTLAEDDATFFADLQRACGNAEKAVDWLLIRYGAEQVAYIEHFAQIRKAELLNRGPVLTCLNCHRLVRWKHLAAEPALRSDSNPLGLIGCLWCKPERVSLWASERGAMGRCHGQMGRCAPVRFFITRATDRTLKRLGAGSYSIAIRTLIALARAATQGRVTAAVTPQETLPLPMDMPPAMPRWME